MKKIILIVTLMVATLALYQTSWQNPFVLDDLTKIQENTDLRTPFSASNFMYRYASNSMHFRNDPSRPVVFMLYWLCWQSGRGMPAPFHILNTALHGLGAVLLALLTGTIVYTLFGSYSILPGLFAGLLFISSPLMAGTVIYAYGLSDVLSTVFLLAGLLALWDTDFALWGVLFYLLALGSKQSAVVFPVLLLTLELFCKRKPSRGRLVKVYLPLMAITAAYLWWRIYFFGALGDIEGRDDVLALKDYAPIQGLMIFKYLGQTLWPAGLSIDHRLLPWDTGVAAKVCGWLAVFLLSAAAFMAWLRNGPPWLRLLSLGWSFFLICLLPTSSLFSTVDLYVERRAYTADIGLFLCAGGLLWLLYQQKKWGKTVALILIGGLTVAQTAPALSRTAVYASPELLWRESLALDPENPRALINLGVYYSAVGRWEESRQMLEELLKIQPQNGSIYSKLAYIYQQPGYARHDDGTAWNYFQKSLAIAPENIFALYNMGVFLLDHGRYAEAEKSFDRATRLSPQMTKAWIAMGQAALAQDKKNEAILDFRQALRLDPDSASTRQTLQLLGVTD